VKANDRRKLKNRKRRIQRRLAPRTWSPQSAPMFWGSNYRYEMGERARGVTVGGLAAIHKMARSIGLIEALDREVRLLKVHLPYHESDHVLNIAYNLMAGNTRLEDLELLRQNESYLDMLGAQRIPDPTTAGDFLRRFEEGDIYRLMDAQNEIRVKLWKRQPAEFRKCARIDADGTLAPTEGEKKEGMEYSYKGVWGYHPLLVSLSNTQEPLYIVNRKGNVPSHEQAGDWMDRAIGLCEEAGFEEIRMRGDTDFSLTGKLDEWTKRGVKFVLGYDAYPNLKLIAEELEEKAWVPLVRPARYEIKTRERKKRSNAKDKVVIERGFKAIRPVKEEVAEFSYRPGKCERSYRMVVVRKTLAVERGQPLLIPNDVRHFFYITNDPVLSAAEVVFEANERCDQENLIEQLKNGVNAMRVPAYDLMSNWAYMVIASLAWTLKAWFALTLPRAADREQVLRMEFKRFLNAIIRIPCQVIRAARQIHLRILAYTDSVRLLFASEGVFVRGASP
jgi:hypothetical protein